MRNGIIRFCKGQIVWNHSIITQYLYLFQKTKKSGIYSYALCGCKLHFEFPVYALQSKAFENPFSPASDNPIALAIQIRQLAVKTHKKPAVACGL